jgi:short-subunit dehydrogenase
MFVILQVDVEVYMMDMSSLTSIRTETAKFLAAYDGPIDILINNAGVGCAFFLTFTAHIFLTFRAAESH